MAVPAPNVLPTQGEIDKAAAILQSDGLVAFPTETVYGLGADATSTVALERIFDAKGRPKTDPLIVHVDSIQQAAALGEMREPGSPAMRLAGEFWPGPLTVIVRRRRPAESGSLSDLVGGGGVTVGMRCPAHPTALALLASAGIPIAAPSANRFGRVSPTTADHVREELGNRVDLILDGGPTPLGIESTVVDCTAEIPRVVRPGGLALEDLQEFLGVVEFDERVSESPDRAATSPGVFAGHYAPRVSVVLVEGAQSQAEALRDLLLAEKINAKLLELPLMATEAAPVLYSRLREADHGSTDVLLASAFDPAGLGRAINDRLFRAAHGHIAPDASPDTVMGIVARVL